MLRAYIRRCSALSTLPTFCAILSLILAFAGSSHGDQTGCIDPSERLPVYHIEPSRVDLVQLLASPPTVDSTAGKVDLQAVVEAQRDRTPEQAEAAKADSCISVFRRDGQALERRRFADHRGLLQQGFLRRKPRHRRRESTLQSASAIRHRSRHQTYCRPAGKRVVSARARHFRIRICNSPRNHRPREGEGDFRSRRCVCA
jgi:hypothetical protein